MERVYLKEVKTDCGQTFRISYLDQVAIGILDPGKNMLSQFFIPDTYSLYQIINDNFILEVTRYEKDQNQLNTSYRRLPENEAKRYFVNGKPERITD